jgi:acetyl-CoA acetyltransferase
MTSSNDVVVIGAAESPYTRRPDPTQTTPDVIADAIRRAVADAGVTLGAVDGLAISSFTLRPDHAVDLAWRLGLRLRWIMEDTNGGASGLNMLQHAVRAVQAGDAEVVVIAAGDRMTSDAFGSLVAEYNTATRDHLTPLPLLGPNALFAMLTQAHMDRTGLDRKHYARIPVAQRRWAEHNPGAVYRTRLALDDVLAAPAVAPPLHRFDCVPPVTGADAVVVTTRDRMPAGAPAARVLTVGGIVNHDGQEGDGLTTGLAEVAPGLWSSAGVGPSDMDVVSVYDDYPVMVLVQLADLGFVPDGDLVRLLEGRVDAGRWPLNTSGGQLSAGQAGAAGGLHGLVEAATQLRGRAGSRQVESARLAAVAGYGMVLYRYGACANLAVLEAVS